MSADRNQQPIVHFVGSIPLADLLILCFIKGMIETRITELFGIRVPVIAGGLQWLATPDYVAAAAHAGIIGFMYLENLSLVDALYFSVVTLGTVGFGDIHPQT